MKSFLTIITISTILNLVQIYGQSGWRADLRVDDEYLFFNQPPEINVSVIAELYYNDELKPVLQNYKYEFFRKYILLPNPEWVEYITSPQWGDNHQGTHTYLDSTIVPEGKFEVYCKITLPDDMIVNSDVITIPWYSVSPDQKKFTGSSFGSIDYWYKGSFKNNNGLNEIYIPRYDRKVLQADINVVSNPPEKYNYWTGNFGATYYKNFVRFSPAELLSTPMVGQFNYINNTTVRAKIDNNYLNVIQFKDPWLRDYDEQPFGIRNQGLLALPQPLDNIDNNLAISTNHQGVLLNQNPTFDPSIPYYSIEIPSSIYLPQTGQAHNLYLQSWDLSGASLQYPNSLTTGVVFTSSIGAYVTANVKATGLSDNVNTYTNNGQRKTVRTPDYVNTLHRVYESLGHVFYETSSNNGQSWTLMNSGHPIDNGGGKSPSIDFTTINQHVFTVIVFQENSGAPPNSSSIKAVVYKSRYGDLPFQYLETETIYSSLFYSYNTNPVLSISRAGSTKIVWEVTGDGLYYRGAGINNDGLNLIGSNAKLSGTTSYSKNPSIAVSKKVGSSDIMHLVWEENNLIKHYTFHSTPPGTITTISSGDGYTYRNRPSVITLSDGGGRICWIGSRYDAGESDNPTMETRTIFRGTGYNHFWAFGNTVSSPNITNSDDETYYAIAWSEEDGDRTKFADNTLYTIRDFNIAGKDIQVRNGATKNQMYADVFKSSNQPYYFEMSNNLGSYYAPQKTTAYTFASGREGVIYQDTAQFYFTVGDILVNEQSIDFIAIPDSIKLNTKEMLNAYLVSEPFQLTDNSLFLYSIKYGASDSSAAVNLLSNTNKFINFKLQLIDAQSLEVLGSFDEVTFDQSNVFRYNNLSYQVNTTGIGNKSVFLRLKVEDNFNPDYSLSQIYSDNDILEKRSIKTINFTGSETPVTYDLAQNFPNPFNPSTTIRYQLPKDGVVTIKIYDILGSEVATMVNEEKTAGKYEVNFNASSLASGVYIYKIQAGDFVNSKKMILLK
jgi:hypothetical protein